MALADIWLNSPDQLLDKHAPQVIAFAGSGRLADGNECSAEFRTLLSLVPSRTLRAYADDCLGTRFDDGGRALQDV
ncbi:MAG TPA: hypothetical protein VJB57_18190, partial [Dehalococcoidia bacterium]|nr:hypothetical protein [Dehalococcoidia bacterium]